MTWRTIMTITIAPNADATVTAVIDCEDAASFAAVGVIDSEITVYDHMPHGLDFVEFEVLTPIADRYTVRVTDFLALEVLDNFTPGDAITVEGTLGVEFAPSHHEGFTTVNLVLTAEVIS